MFVKFIFMCYRKLQSENEEISQIPCMAILYVIIFVRYLRKDLLTIALEILVNFTNSSYNFYCNISACHFFSSSLATCLDND